MCTKKLIFLKCWAAIIHVSELLSFTMIIFAPDRCGVSRRLLSSMIIWQVALNMSKKSRVLRRCAVQSCESTVWWQIDRNKEKCSWMWTETLRTLTSIHEKREQKQNVAVTLLLSEATHIAKENKKKAVHELTDWEIWLSCMKWWS